MKRILTGRTVEDAHNVLKNFDQIKIRVGFDVRFKTYLSTQMIPSFLNMMYIKNVFSDRTDGHNSIFLTVGS